MGLTDRLRAIIDGMPADGAVTLPVAFLSRLIEAEGDSPGMGRLLTLEGTAEIVSRSPSTIRTWLNTGQLTGAFKLQGRAWRIPEADLQRFIERQQDAGHGPPTVREAGPVDLGAWREHVKPDQGAA